MPAVPRIYSPGEANIVAPVIVRQVLPDYPGQPFRGGKGSSRS